jgi:tRNA 2-selenouridine synthase
MKKISAENFIQHLVLDGKCIDVRAPIEFIQGAIPGSVNRPLLDNQQRVLVGTCYKNAGKEAAIKLGHKLVSGADKSTKIDLWKHYLIENPHAVITCFRGGLRSQTTQSFLNEVGIETMRIEDGYKKVRQLYLNKIDHFSQTGSKDKMIILTGETGSAKTKIIQLLNKNFVIDLEKHAEHKGSAFGRTARSQPSQASFENLIAQDLFYLSSFETNRLGIVVEDESRCIGSLHLPEVFFNKMRSSPVVKIIETLDFRVNHIFSDYITNDILIYDYFKNAIRRIQKKLGGLRSAELIDDIEKAQLAFQIENSKLLNKVWIEKLLVWYYDPMYQSSFKMRSPAIDFQGSYTEVMAYLEESQNQTSNL